MDENETNEELLELYDYKKNTRGSDAVSVQTAVSIIMAAGFFGAFFMYRQQTGELVSLIEKYAGSGRELFPNPIGYLISLL